MLDVIHFFFEEDSGGMFTAEHGEARDKLREYIYLELYNRDYLYSVSSAKTGVSGDIDPPFGDDDDDDLPIPVDPFERANGSRPVKPYVPATTMNPNSSLPFGSVLDGPLG
jgi:hypothetical protein